MGSIGMTASAMALLLAAGAAQQGDAPKVEPWAPPAISSASFESHPAFDPRNGDLYFVRSTPSFEGWRILVSHCGADGWSPPQVPAFAGDGVEADPWFSADGRSLWFISTRSSDGIQRKDLDIWRVERDAQGRWGEPQRLPVPVNSDGREWFPREARDGWLYFGSDRPGGHGRTDIWRARRNTEGRWHVENAGTALNSAGDEYEALPAPDSESLILMTADGLYRSHRSANGWSARTRLPAPINLGRGEVGALFSPSGQSLLFARDSKGPKSGELYLWRIAGNEAWPPVCPVKRKP